MRVLVNYHYIARLEVDLQNIAFFTTETEKLWPIKLLTPVSFAEPASLNVQSVPFPLETIPTSSTKHSVLTVLAITTHQPALPYARQRASSKPEHNRSSIVAQSTSAFLPSLLRDLNREKSKSVTFIR